MRRRSVVLAVIVSCVILYLAHRVDQAHRRSASNVSTNATAQLFGTWKTTDGSVFDFRPDGTGRSYYPARGKSDIHYFEWTADPTTFTIVYAPRGTIKGLIAKSLGAETATFAIGQQTTNSFTLTDAPSAASTRFERTEDAIIENAF